MMLRRQSPLVRRVVAVLLVLVLVGSALAVALMPWYRIDQLDGREAATERALAGEAGTESLRRALSEERETLVANGRDRSSLLPGTTVGLAAAELQRYAAEVVASHGGRLRSSLVLTPKTADDLTFVSLRLVLDLETPALRDILLALEAGSPLLQITRMSVVAPPAGRAGQPADRWQTLQTPLDVQGAMSTP